MSKLTMPDRPVENTFRAAALEQEDARLLARCRQQDESAWKELVERFETLVCAIPRRAGLDEESVSEVFQEVFLTLLERLEKIEQPERIRAWLVTTAKYKTWRWLGKRTAVTELTVADDELSAQLEPQSPSPIPLEVLLELEEQHLIRTAVNALDERCRKIIGMLFYTDQPAAYAEIAEAIGVGETSISPLRARCLKKIERLLRK